MRQLLLLILCLVPFGIAKAQEDTLRIDDAAVVVPTTIVVVPELTDTVITLNGQRTRAINSVHLKDLGHSPHAATMYAALVPGLGQIYNRKYWKLPIVYGGFVGCIYAISWNNQMYHDYAQAYIDLMDDDPRTQSYNQFLHLGVTITDANASQYQELFRKRKDRYRRWRDLSVFALVAVYALSVIDAYVDASLSEFDISKDLSLRITPTILNDDNLYCNRNPLKSSAVGVGCSLKF